MNLLAVTEAIARKAQVFSVSIIEISKCVIYLFVIINYNSNTIIRLEIVA